MLRMNDTTWSAMNDIWDAIHHKAMQTLGNVGFLENQTPLDVDKWNQRVETQMDQLEAMLAEFRSEWNNRNK